MGSRERQSFTESPTVLFVLTGSHSTPSPTFTTFQPLDLTRKSCQGLLKETRLQALQAGEAQFSPRAPDVHAVVSGNLGCSSFLCSQVSHG